MTWFTTFVRPDTSTSRVVTRDTAFYTRHTLETFFKPRLLQELVLDATGSDNPEKEEFTLEENHGRG